MTIEQAEKFLDEYKVHGCRDYRDASLLGQAMAATMSDEVKAECSRIISKHLNASVVKPE
jgi:hypothetical protein